MAFTPAIQQYLDVKKQYPDCILFFRIGDFYETFFDDAKICSKVLDLILTSKNKNAEDPVPMAGIPFHSVDKYIPKLVAHGYKVAIAEQTSEPIPGRIVEREVTQIITPGTFIQEGKKGFTYILAVYFKPYSDGTAYHIAWGDFSLGEYWTKSFQDIAQMQQFILTLRPSEVVFDVDFSERTLISSYLTQEISSLISLYEVPFNATDFLLHMTKVQSLSSFGKAVEEGRLSAIALLLNYISNTQKTDLRNIAKIALHSQNDLVLLDDVTLKNLEIFSSSYEHSEKYSLVGILDRTRTSGGSRLLRYLLGHPTNNLQTLETRLSHISYYLQENMIRPQLVGVDTHKISAALATVTDIQKVMSTLLYKKLSPNVYIKLRATLRIFFDSAFLCKELTRLGLSDEHFTQVQHLYNHLQQLLKDDTDFQEDMNFIRDGYHADIDELRKVAYHSDELLMHYQQELSLRSGINTVKLKYVMNQGYFVEITNKDIENFEKKLLNTLDQVNSDEQEKFEVIRRNTLKGGQRYTTPYLESIQTQVIEAKDDLIKREFQLLEESKAMVAKGTVALTRFAEVISWLDVYTSHALFAHEKKYIQPELINNTSLVITGGRHPVIEAFLPRDQQFIPNTLALNTELKIENGKLEIENSGFLHIITGPNMGGKSTYLRQNALIVLLAHCGLYVPAEKATIGLVDALFARVGSGDVIAKNQSTFMTEMIEVANILHNATNKSFIIFDELGRGTSTYDGLAITKAILEYVATHIQARTLIATHYHELIQLEETLPGVQNYSVNVYETDKEVVFMKKIVRGGASKSYGIDVAKIAGIPSVILDKAKYNLASLQNKNGELKIESGENKRSSGTLDFKIQAPSEDPRYEKIKRFLDGFDLNSITPLQALQLLSKVKDDLSE